MRIPTISGIIDRRILANYRIDPACMAGVLPAPFRPQLVAGYAIGGICLIRLANVRPRWLPAFCGLTSENAAHRMAVEWDEEGRTCQGVYIPRRDTDSWLNALVGGRVFPGVHHHATFQVEESDTQFSVDMISDDGAASVTVAGRLATEIPKSSVFGSLRTASDFFAQGSLGYSDTQQQGRFDGLELSCRGWHVDALEVDEIRSSYFDDRGRFSEGSVQFDCALLMRGIAHEWHGKPELCCTPQPAASAAG